MTSVSYEAQSSCDPNNQSHRNTLVSNDHVTVKVTKYLESGIFIFVSLNFFQSTSDFFSFQQLCEQALTTCQTAMNACGGNKISEAVQ